jgi:hypothetical protein
MYFSNCPFTNYTNKIPFKENINRLHKKAEKAYFSIRKDFNFYNGTSPRTIVKLFDSMVQPIAIYGCEIWACFDWHKQTSNCISNWLHDLKHPFEKIHLKMCKNVLGISRSSSNEMSRMELGRLPIMCNIIKHIFSYWQHILSQPENSLVHQALKSNIILDRNGFTSYYTRIKSLLAVLDERDKLYAVDKTFIKKYSAMIKNKFNDMHKGKLQELLYKKVDDESKGKFSIYSDIKNFFNKMEDYLKQMVNNQLRRNITKIRISEHPLPIERLRKSGKPRNERICNLCDHKEIGTEYHVLIYCDNQQITKHRKLLFDKIFEVNYQLKKFSSKQIFIHLLMASDARLNFYFAIYLDKIFKLHKL